MGPGSITAQRVESLDTAVFAPFGEVIAVDTAVWYPIDTGQAERYHDLARIDIAHAHPSAWAISMRAAPGSG